MADSNQHLLGTAQRLNGVPCYVNKLLAAGTLRIYDRDRPTVYIEADSQETLREVVHLTNALLSKEPAPESVEKLLGYPVVVDEWTGPKERIRFGTYPDFSKPPHVPKDEL